MMKHFIQTQCPVFFWLPLVCAITLLGGCNDHSYGSPEGYDLNNPETMQLGKVLNEISGLTYNVTDHSLLAISDSKRKVIQIIPERHKLKDFTGNIVPPDSDIEDLVLKDSMLYLLASKGIIYEARLRAQDTTGVHAYPFWSQDKNDFETLYFDAITGNLVMVCKSCAAGKKDESHSAYRFNLKTKQFDTSAYFAINDKDVQDQLKDDKVKFRPSAAAIHPFNKRLYILASAGNLLVIADTHGQVVEAYHLNPDYFPQAEGICFAPNGDMYISNEGKYGRATLLYFPYKDKGNNK